MRSPVVIFFLAFIALFVFVKEIPAQVYKYVDKDGVIHFTDTPSDPKFKSEDTVGWNKSIRSEEKKEAIKPSLKKNSGSPARRHYHSKKYPVKKIEWLTGIFKK